LKLPRGWELFDREEREWKGERYFWNRYIHRESKSGINYFSTFKDGEKVFVVEGYGVGTIDPDTFKEISDIAPIQRCECDSQEEAEKALIGLMEENTNRWKS
jgi:hypothetical protein